MAKKKNSLLFAYKNTKKKIAKQLHLLFRPKKKYQRSTTEQRRMVINTKRRKGNKNEKRERQRKNGLSNM